MNLLDEGLHLFAEFERGTHQLRTLVAQHTFKELLMENLDSLIGKFHDLKAERADLVADRDAQKTRADKAEADLKAAQDEKAADEAKVKAALDEMSAEVEVEKPATVVVSAPTTAPVISLPVSGGSMLPIGSAVTGPGIADGTTIVGSHASVNGDASVMLSQPTMADHVGDGSETLVVTPSAAEPVATAETPASAIEIPAAS